jgi:3-phosphoshikimate 1-carboxyvinyltransferase
MGIPIISDKEGQYLTFDRISLNGGETHDADCGESGSTLRFLLPVACALGLSISFVMGGRLPSRPISDLTRELVAHGCIISELGKTSLTCEGQLTSGNYSIPGDISSQYVSGLLMALPILSGDSILQVNGILESRPYVDLTLKALSQFGVTVTEEDNQLFRIP